MANSVQRLPKISLSKDKYDRGFKTNLKDQKETTAQKETITQQSYVPGLQLGQRSSRHVYPVNLPYDEYSQKGISGEIVINNNGNESKKSFLQDGSATQSTTDNGNGASCTKYKNQSHFSFPDMFEDPTHEDIKQRQRLTFPPKILTTEDIDHSHSFKQHQFPFEDYNMIKKKFTSIKDHFAEDNGVVIKKPDIMLEGNTFCENNDTQEH